MPIENIEIQTDFSREKNNINKIWALENSIKVEKVAHNNRQPIDPRRRKRLGRLHCRPIKKEAKIARINS